MWWRNGRFAFLNGNVLKYALTLTTVFELNIIEKLRNKVYKGCRSAKWVRALCGKGLLAFDDCSAAVMYKVRG